MNADSLQTSEANPQGCNESGAQGSTRTSQRTPFAPTTEILNADGVAISWELIEETARQIGIPKTAEQFKLPLNTIHSRKKSHKWKKIPDGRALTKTDKGSDAQLSTMTGDLSGEIDRHRAMVFQKTSKSIAKFRAKAPKNFREFDAADKIARRALGIDDDKPAQQSVLIQVNEAIAEHNAPVPIEANEIPCIPAPLPNESVDEGQQGDDTPPAESNAPKESATPRGSLTLNPGDSKSRQFVLP